MSDTLYVMRQFTHSIVTTMNYQMDILHLVHSRDPIKFPDSIVVRNLSHESSSKNPNSEMLNPNQ